MKNNIWYAMRILVLLGLFGCGGQPKEEVTQYRVGEKIMVEKLSLTVQSVVRNLVLPNEGFSETPLADSSKENIGVQLLVMNEGKYSLSFKMNELMIKDSSGKFYSGTPQGGPGNLLSTGRFLAMGDKISGMLIYTVPKGAKGLTLVYKPVKLRNKTYQISL